jgi:hypothetical protein
VRRAALGGLLLGLLAACSKPSTTTEELPASPVVGSARALPADHLASDELVEGKEQAFGVILPRGLTVDERHIEVVKATGTMNAHALVKYFQAHLIGGSLREGERSATFEHVRASGTPPDTDLAIHIATFVQKTTVDVSATPIVAAPVLPDEESRWREVGLTPEGKVLDPTHLH